MSKKERESRLAGRDAKTGEFVPLEETIRGRAPGLTLLVAPG